MATIYGTNGSDTLTGTAGNDTIYGWAPGGSQATDTGNDSISGVGGADQLFGGGGNDTIRAGSAATISGGSGDDHIFAGSLLHDSVDGGGGQDVLDFSGHGTGVYVDDNSAGASSGSQTETIAGIESVVGSDFGDTLNAFFSAGLDGGAGDDSLQSFFGEVHGGPGADTLVGDEYGTNLSSGTASYSGSPAAVNVTLGTHGMGSGKGGDAEGDVLQFISNLVGSDFGDTLVGDDHANSLSGGAGNDSLIGDTVQGGSGADTLVGWTVDYGTSPSGVTVSLLNHVAQGGDATGDSLTGIRHVTGSAFNDSLEGDSFGNSLDGGAGQDTLIGGDGLDTLRGGAGADSLDGGAGIDTADYSGSNIGVNVSLVTDRGLYGDAAGDSLIGIERLTGGYGNDTLTGDGGANSLSGGFGDDMLVGGAGADTLNGGVSSDTASYAGSGAGVSVSLVTHMGHGGDAAGDSLTGIENLVGSALGDTLVGDANPNLLSGAEGSDSLAGGSGADTLDGGAGTDTADYSASTAGVKVALANHTAMGGDAEGDSLIAIENLTGSGWSDTVIGDGNANSLDGGAGADSLVGGSGDDILRGGAGADTLNGTAGAGDFASYVGSAAAVKVVLATGLASGGDAAGDSLAGIENLIGSTLNDTLIGDAGANSLVGALGNDSLVGGQGADTLSGSGGNDTLSGSGGNDHFIFTPGSGQDVVTDFHHAAAAGQEQDKLDLTAFHFASTADALSHASSDGTNTYFNLDNDPATHEITLLGVAHVNANDVLV